jgi:hypothetical protein
MTSRPRDPVAQVLAELHLVVAEPRFLTGLHAWLRTALDGCTPGAIREAGTVLGELVANAFRHAAPPYQVRLTTSGGGHLIRLAVAEGTSGDAGGWRLGRGLVIVRGLCLRWGVTPYHLDGAAGKTIWADLQVMAPPTTVA